MEHFHTHPWDEPPRLHDNMRYGQVGLFSYMSRRGRRVSLKGQINCCLQRNAFDGRPFLPNGCQLRILQPVLIRYQLEHFTNLYARYDSAYIDNLVDFISNQAGRVFLILIKLGFTSRIVDFRRHGFTDDLLPISVQRKSGTAFSVEIRALNHTLSGAFEDWTHDESDIEDFAETQWTFIAPTLNNFICDIYRSGTILPFIKKGEEKYGGFSKVMKFELHPDHLVPTAGLRPPYVLALKQFTPDHGDEDDQRKSRSMFLQECKALQTMRELNNDHLIKLMTGFIMSETNFLVFPWAPAGNIRDLWREPDADQTGTELGCIGWFIQQLTGLLSAIHAMHSHQPACIHGDLTPENLLLFPQEGEARPRIVIADFGLSRMYGVGTAARIAARCDTKTPWRTPLYEAPELQNVETKELTRARSNDIWQIGCIALEFLIWVSWGPGPNLTFYNERIQSGKFWTVVTGHKILHPEVRDTMRRLQDEGGRCEVGTGLGDVLALIKRLLVVEGEGSDHRANSLEAYNEALRIYAKVAAAFDSAQRGEPVENWLYVARSSSSHSTQPPANFHIT